MSNFYDIGDRVRVTGTLRDAGGVLADADVVVAKYRDPGGIITVLTHGVDEELVHLDTGIYYFDVSPATPGKWDYRFESTGMGQGAVEGYFSVANSVFG